MPFHPSVYGRSVLKGVTPNVGSVLGRPASRAHRMVHPHTDASTGQLGSLKGGDFPREGMSSGGWGGLMGWLVHSFSCWLLTSWPLSHLPWGHWKKLMSPGMATGWVTRTSQAVAVPWIRGTPKDLFRGSGSMHGNVRLKGASGHPPTPWDMETYSGDQPGHLVPTGGTQSS